MIAIDGRRTLGSVLQQTCYRHCNPGEKNVPAMDLLARFRFGIRRLRDRGAVAASGASAAMLRRRIVQVRTIWRRILQR